MTSFFAHNFLAVYPMNLILESKCFSLKALSIGVLGCVFGTLWDKLFNSDFTYWQWIIAWLLAINEVLQYLPNILE